MTILRSIFNATGLGAQQLTSNATLSGTDVLVINQGGTDAKVTLVSLAAFLAANGGLTTTASITAPTISTTQNTPATFAVTVAGSGAPTVYASITSGGVEQTPRTAITYGSTSVSLTPTAATLSTASIYTAATGGSAVATSASFTPGVATSGAASNTYMIAWYQGTPPNITATANAPNWSYAQPGNNSTNYMAFMVTPTAGGSALPNTTAVSAGFSTSSTVPPGAATLPTGFNAPYYANGTRPAIAATITPYFTYSGCVAAPVGSGAIVYYFWVKTPDGNYSVFRNSSGVPIGITVTF